MAGAKVIPGPEAAYRSPAERPRLLDSERRWFMKTGEVHKGPYAADVLARSIQSGVLRRTSLVRAEDETEWRPAYTVDALKALLQGPRGPGWSKHPEDAPSEERGSMGAGFVAGFFGGVIGVVLVLALAKGPDTKRGVWAGLGVGFAVWMAMRMLLGSMW